jgi:UDP-3-O-[3-hydroxymyristoyl] glucosamine N-acyltransferase
MLLNTSLKEISQVIHGKLHGNTDLKIHRLLPLHQAEIGDLSFVSSKKYLHAARKTKASALVLSKHLDVVFSDSILVDDANLAVTALCHYFSTQRSFIKNIHSSVQIGPNAVIEEGISIGENSHIGANCFIGVNSHIGSNTIIFPNVTIYPDTIIENNVRIHSGCVIGADGFGYHHQSQQWRKILQVGHVHVDSDVEIGANSCIDRARLGRTYIGKRTKIDNLVHIAHGVHVGDDCLICGCTGIAGSVHIGNRVTIAGQCGIADHVEIASDTTLAVRTSVYRNIEKEDIYWGMLGAQNIKAEKDSLELYRMLPELYNRILQLEKKT